MNAKPHEPPFFRSLTGPLGTEVNDSEVRGTVFSAFTLFDDLGKGLGRQSTLIATYRHIIYRNV